MNTEDSTSFMTHLPHQTPSQSKHPSLKTKHPVAEPAIKELAVPALSSQKKTSSETISEGMMAKGTMPTPAQPTLEKTSNISQSIVKGTPLTSTSSSPTPSTSASPASIDAFQIAIETGNSKAVRELVERKDIDITQLINGEPVIMLAIRERSPEMVYLLHSLGANLEQTIISGSFRGETPMARCVKMNDHEMVELLHKLDANLINQPDKDGETLLNWSVRMDEPTTVELLCKLGADANKPGKDGYSTIMLAVMAKTKPLEMVRLIYDNSKRIKLNLEEAIPSGPWKGETLITWSVKNNKPDMVKLLSDLKNLLLSAPPSPIPSTSPSSTSINAFQAAIANGDSEAVRKLVERKDIDITQPINGEPVIMLAIRERSSKMVCLLHSLGANLEQTIISESFRGETPMARCVKMNDHEMVELLHKLDANLINQPDKDGETLLNWSVRMDEPTTVELLCKLGADANKPGKDGYSTIMLAVMARTNPLKMVRLLYDNSKIIKLNLEAIIPSGPWKGETLITWSVKNNNTDMIKLLCELGADVNKPGNDGYPPIMHAIYANSSKMVSLLHSLGAYLREDASELLHGKTPMIWAVQQNDMNMVRLLKELGADINKPGLDGKTPMIWSVQQNDMNMVKLLKELGADINKPGLNGYPPITLTNSPEMVVLLHNLNADMEQVTPDGSTPIAIAIMRDDQRLRKLLKACGANEKRGESIVRKKFLAQIWGLPGQSYTEDHTNIKFDLSGLLPEYAIHKLSEYADRFFTSKVYQDTKIKIKLEDQKTILESIANAFPVSSRDQIMSNETIEKIRLGKPVVILGGFEGHAISMVICKNKLVVFNRGAGQEALAAEFYELDAKNMKTEDLQKILKDLITQHPNSRAFKTMIKNLNLPYDPQSGYNHKGQKMGNCTLASMKGIFGVLCNFYAESSEESSKDKKSLYKPFSAFCRQKARTDYENLGPKLDSEDLFLLYRIDKKIEGKQRRK